MKTKSGKHVIFHIDRNPFVRLDAPLPLDWLEQAIDNGEWFFLPEDGNPTAYGRLRGYPQIYSAGYPTKEAALNAAEEWEIQKQKAPEENFDQIKWATIDI